MVRTRAAALREAHEQIMHKEPAPKPLVCKKRRAFAELDANQVAPDNAGCCKVAKCSGNGARKAASQAVHEQQQPEQLPQQPQQPEPGQLQTKQPSRQDEAAAGAAASRQLRGAQAAAQARQQRGTGGASLSSVLQRRAAEIRQPQQHETAASSPLPLIDVDKENPQSCCDYACDVHRNYRSVEPQYRVPTNYMETQREVTARMRSILVDWLVDVNLKFKLMSETFFLGVGLLDRYLALRQVKRSNLQLAGMTAMSIAAKYEEIWAPFVKDWVYISDNTYTKAQMLAMERDMLQVLDFSISQPTVYHFAARSLRAAGVCPARRPAAEQVCWYVGYICELSAVDYGMLKYAPSLIAAAAVHVALEAAKAGDTYPHTLQRHSGYSHEDVHPCVCDIVSLLRTTPHSSLKAVYRKYSGRDYGQVALTRAPVHLL